MVRSILAAPLVVTMYSWRGVVGKFLWSRERTGVHFQVGMLAKVGGDRKL